MHGRDEGGNGVGHLTYFWRTRDLIKLFGVSSPITLPSPTPYLEAPISRTQFYNYDLAMIRVAGFGRPSFGEAGSGHAKGNYYGQLSMTAIPVAMGN